MRTTDHDLIRQSNRHRILSALRPSGTLARIELAERTALSPATVTVLTQELLEEGLLLERASDEAQPQGTRQRGRPRIGLALNPDATFVVGAKISMHQIAVSVTNFIGEVVHAETSAVRVNRAPPEEVADQVESLVTGALGHLDQPKERISGLGIGIPGFIDHRAGVCHWSPVFGTTAVPFARMMHQRLGLPVHLDNDANLVTLAELWFGTGREHRDFVLVTVEHGVGMGAVIEGKVYRGHGGFGSEFGHSKIQRDGALCRCGQRGCVEAYVADYAIVREASAFGDATDLADPIKVRQAINGLAARARSGDRQVAQLFVHAGEVLGAGMANLVNILNPPLIILSGTGVLNYDLYAEALNRSLRANSLSADRYETPVITGAWDDEVWARGAAALVLESLYSPPLT